MIALYGEILKHTGCMMATIDDVHYNQDCEKGPSI